MDVANFSNPNEPSFVNTILSRGLYVGIMTIDNNKMDRIYTQLHIFGLGTTVSTQILRRRSNFRKWFLGAFLFKFEQSAVIIKMPF